MTYVNYIEKTQDYYRRKGYDRVYQYACNSETPFTPLRKKLAESRAILITSAGVEIVPDDGPVPTPFKGRNIGEKGRTEVFDIPSSLRAEKLVYVTGSHNHRENAMRDIDAFLPITRLREMVDEERLGSLAENHLRIRPRYSQRETRELDAPEVLRRAQAQGVDVALLAPV